MSNERSLDDVEQTITHSKKQKTGQQRSTKAHHTIRLIHLSISSARERPHHVRTSLLYGPIYRPGNRNHCPLVRDDHVMHGERELWQAAILITLPRSPKPG